jgi:hypothetical protein
MVGPSLHGYTIAPCVDSKVRICISHIYILVVSFLPRLGEPLAHSLELWFLHVCVSYLPLT